jgi:hypothetical protein
LRDGEVGTCHAELMMAINGAPWEGAGQRSEPSESSFLERHDGNDCPNLDCHWLAAATVKRG